MNFAPNKPQFFFCFQAYHDPMLKLSIMTEQELNQIFGTLDSLIPLHEGKTQIVFVCIIIAHRFKSSGLLK